MTNDITAKIAGFDNKLLLEALIREVKKADAFDMDAYARIDALRSEVLKRMEA